MQHQSVIHLLGAALIIVNFGAGNAHADEQLERGKAIYEEKCHTCHQLHATTEMTQDMWQKKLPSMEPMAQITDDADKAALRAYLLANAGTREGILAEEKGYFSKNCGSCHDPDQPMTTDMDFADLQEFVEEHMEEQDLDELEDVDLHESSEYIIHSQLWHQ